MNSSIAATDSAKKNAILLNIIHFTTEDQAIYVTGRDEIWGFKYEGMSRGSNGDR